MALTQQHRLQSGEQLTIVQTLDDWLGPTLAIVANDVWPSPVLINLVAWEGSQLKNRIYGARDLTVEATETYLANINRDYCDLTRKTSETEALIQTTAQKAQLILINLPDLVVSAASEELFNAPFRDWQAIKPEEFDDWRTFL